MPQDIGSPLMKRSSAVRLTLTGTVAASLTAAGCQQSETTPVPVPTTLVSTNQVYTNNTFVAGSGYYHAPFRAWYSHPFNTYWPNRGYFYGGQWWATPYQGALDPSRPTPSAVLRANGTRDGYAPAPVSEPGIVRGGFGSSHASESAGS